MELKTNDQVLFGKNGMATVKDRFIQNIELEENDRIRQIKATAEDPFYLIELQSGEQRIVRHTEIEMI